MPKAQQNALGYWPLSLFEDAQLTGPCTGQLVEAILAAKRHPEMRYRSCLGILRLAKIYPAERMEAAAQRALRARAYNCQSMESILKNQLDRLPPAGDHRCNVARITTTSAAPITLIFRRRPSLRLFSKSEKRRTCLTTTIEKLYIMRMRGMADAFTQQQEDPQTTQLSFEERFGLLVDQQWNWRQNRALEWRRRDGRLQGEPVSKISTSVRREV
jgi:hypothetical protein